MRAEEKVPDVTSALQIRAEEKVPDITSALQVRVEKKFPDCIENINVSCLSIKFSKSLFEVVSFGMFIMISTCFQ